MMILDVKFIKLTGGEDRMKIMTIESCKVLIYKTTLC